jgi:hypothetical protein
VEREYACLSPSLSLCLLIQTLDKFHFQTAFSNEHAM